MSMIRFLSSLSRDKVRCAFSSRTLRLETLESRLQLSAVPAELAFESFSQEDAVVVPDEQVSTDLGDSIPNQTMIDVALAEATSVAEDDLVTADALVCWPVDPDAAAATIDAMMQELAQANPDESDALWGTLDSVGPSLPILAASGTISPVDFEAAPSASPEEPSGEDWTSSEVGTGTVLASVVPTEPGEGEPMPAPAPAPAPAPSSAPSSPNAPSGQLEGPQASLLAIVEFSVTEGYSSIYTARGRVEHDLPWTVTVVFGGLFDGHSTPVQTNGSFEYPVMLSAGISGSVSAQGIDESGERSNVWFSYIA